MSQPSDSSADSTQSEQPAQPLADSRGATPPSTGAQTQPIPQLAPGQQTPAQPAPTPQSDRSHPDAVTAPVARPIVATRPAAPAGSAAGAAPAAGPAGPPAKRPVAAPPVLAPALVIGVAVVLAGVVGVHDALTRGGVLLHGYTWVGATIEHVNGTTSATWMSVAGIAVVLLGLWLVVLAVKPRKVRGRQLRADTGIWLDARGVARVASATATAIDGIDEAHSAVGRRSVTVEAVLALDAGLEPSELATRVRAAVEEQLRQLVTPPRVRVHLHSASQPRAPQPRAPQPRAPQPGAPQPGAADTSASTDDGPEVSR